MHQVTDILDTGVGPNLDIKAFIPTDWKRRMKLVHDPGLSAATNTPVRVDVILSLHVRIGD